MVASAGKGAGGLAADDWFNAPVKILWLLSMFRDRWQWFDLLSLLPLVAMLYAGLRSARLRFSPVLGWPALLCLGAFAFLPRLLSPGTVDVTGEVPESTLLRFLWLPFYGLIGVGLIVAGRDVWRVMFRSPWLVLLALLAVASALWSIDPELSFRRGIAVLATTLMGLYLAARYDWISALRLLAVV